MCRSSLFNLEEHYNDSSKLRSPSATSSGGPLSKPRLLVAENTAEPPKAKVKATPAFTTLLVYSPIAIIGSVSPSQNSEASFTVHSVPPSMAADPLASSSASLSRPSLLLSSLPPFSHDSAWPRTPPWLVRGADTASFRRASFRTVKVHAVVAQSGGPKWWERKGGSNMIDIHSAEEFLNALSQAGDRLVVVEFYGTWCASCRAMFPKLCRTAKDNSDVIFLKVDFDENNTMCKRLNVKVVPYFHFYRGADGQLEAFSCSLAKFQRIKEAIAVHNSPRCSIGPSFNMDGLALLDT